MKFQVVFAVFVSAMVASAQVVPPLGGAIPPLGVPGLPIVPPIIPPFLFPGLGFRPFFGLRRLAMFGGLGLGMPFGPFGLFGKRDVETVEKMEKAEQEEQKAVAEKSVAEKLNEEAQKQEQEEKKVEKSIEESKVVEKAVEEQVAQEEQPRTLCSLSTEEKRLRCECENKTLECAVRPQIGELGSIKLRIADLVFRRNEDVIELVGRDSKITAVSPVDKSDILISLFNGKHEKLVGFEVEERECYEKIEKLVEKVVPEKLRVSLFVQA